MLTHATAARSTGTDPTASNTAHHALSLNFGRSRQAISE
jgi:hypothetical protein